MPGPQEDDDAASEWFDGTLSEPFWQQCSNLWLNMVVFSLLFKILIYQNLSKSHKIHWVFLKVTIGDMTCIYYVVCMNTHAQIHTYIYIYIYTYTHNIVLQHVIHVLICILCVT